MPIAETPPTRHEYRIVAIAPASARLRPAVEVRIDDVPSSQGPVAVIMRTRWEPAGFDAPIPRELLIEVRGAADSIAAARSAFVEVARFFGTMLAFVTNVQVGYVELLLAYDSTPDLDEREYVQSFLPDERGLIREGRMAEPHLLLAFAPAAASHAEGDRMARAIAQYELALRDWRIGAEALCLSHLYMAAEALTDAVIRSHCTADGISVEEFAQSLGVVVDDPDLPRWRPELATRVRKEIIFAGDAAVYKAAREASDGFEHGYMEFSEIHRRAQLATLATFRYIRAAIVDLLALDPSTKDELKAIVPRDVLSLRKLVHGVFIGPGAPAGPNHEYPALDWTSSVKSLRWQEDGQLDVGFTENMTVRSADGVGFVGHSFEFTVREEDGRPMLTDGSNVTVVSDSDNLTVSQLDRLLDQTLEFVDSYTVEPLPLVSWTTAHAVRSFWRAHSLFVAALAVLRRQQPEEANVLGCLLFEDSLHLAEFERSDDVGRANLANTHVWEGVRRTAEWFQLVHELNSDSENVSEVLAVLNERISALDTAYEESSTGERRRYVTDVTAATALGRSDDFEMYQLASSLYVYGGMDSLVNWNQVDAAGIELHTQTSELWALSAAGCWLARSLLCSLRAIASVIGWHLDAARCDSLMQRLTDFDKAAQEQQANRTQA